MPQRIDESITKDCARETFLLSHGGFLDGTHDGHYDGHSRRCVAHSPVLPPRAYDANRVRDAQRSVMNVAHLADSFVDAALESPTIVYKGVVLKSRGAPIQFSRGDQRGVNRSK